MLDSSTPLILGSRIVFSDRSSARLQAMEIDESWEVLNLVVTKGFLRWKRRVRLPFTTASRWSESTVDLTCTSTEAFAREIPPVAAPSRPISNETPMAPPDASIGGVLVNPQTRKAAFVIVRIGTKSLRAPISDLMFEGKALRLTALPDALDEHRPDRDIAEEAWRLLRNDRLITPDELAGLQVSSNGGILTLTGNVRRNSTKRHAENLASSVAGITKFQSKVHDDLQLEIDIATRLNSESIPRIADVYARSSLGEVTLFGRAASSQIAEDAVRFASGVEGVLSVTSRIEIAPESSAQYSPAGA